MSEEFDKEAEREKLRQQLAAEEESRQATQHMSELLLKGATMTNRHCDECGDPIFRHDGQEFCPTCGRQGSGGGQSSSAEGSGEAEAAGDGGTAAAGPAGTPQPTQPESPSTGAGGSSGPAQPQQGIPQPTGEADLPAAREALARKVTALAQEAEATADVGRARELLAAVREGAEALRALERGGR